MSGGCFSVCLICELDVLSVFWGVCLKCRCVLYAQIYGIRHRFNKSDIADIAVLVPCSTNTTTIRILLPIIYTKAIQHIGGFKSWCVVVQSLAHWTRSRWVMSSIPHGFPEQGPYSTVA